MAHCRASTISNAKTRIKSHSCLTVVRLQRLDAVHGKRERKRERYPQIETLELLICLYIIQNNSDKYRYCPASGIYPNALPVHNGQSNASSGRPMLVFCYRVEPRIEHRSHESLCSARPYCVRSCCATAHTKMGLIQSDF